MLIGENIRLKPVAAEDAQLVAGWFSDPDYLGDHFNIWPATPQEWEGVAARKMGPESGTCLIMDRETDEPMGNIGYFCPFTLTDMYRGLELYWVVHPRFRNRGIATQAACLLVNHLFNATPTERLHATVVVGNEDSCRVAERAGMQRDGIYRNVFFLHGRYVDMHLYAIVRGDWKDEASYRKSRRPF